MWTAAAQPISLRVRGTGGYLRRIKQTVPPTPKTGKPKLLDEVRRLIRTKHYSRRTEDTYCEWIRRFILHHGKRHPRDLDEGGGVRVVRTGNMGNRLTGDMGDTQPGEYALEREV